MGGSLVVSGPGATTGSSDRVIVGLGMTEGPAGPSWEDSH